MRTAWFCFVSFACIACASSVPDEGVGDNAQGLGGADDDGDAAECAGGREPLPPTAAGVSMWCSASKNKDDAPVPSGGAGVVIAVQRDGETVACGCSIGRGDAPPQAGVPAQPGGGGRRVVMRAERGEAGEPSVPSVPGVPGVPATMRPPSCAELVEQCYADDNDAEVCEQFADCCGSVEPPSVPGVPAVPL